MPNREAISDFPDAKNYHYDTAREEAVSKAIKFIKNCPYKGTAIKIELEAQLGRENNTRSCANCNGSGEMICSECDATLDNCSPCDSNGFITCEGCNGEGRSSMGQRSLNEQQCQDFLLANVSSEAKNSLIFSKTYYDGSVDTEFTFTLPIDKARYAVEFIRSFKKLSKHITQTPHVYGAGMHIAILNSTDGYYPEGNRLDPRRTKNFKESMTKLLPALFFLASSDYRSRRLNYRLPRVSANKYSAISYLSNCFEYRVFETCYDRPEAILDFICIIANTLQYYHYRKKTHSFFGKVGKFGFIDLGQGIERFYKNETNYKALMEGVKILKPSYKTITELKRERNFKLNLTKIRTKEKLKENIWRGEYRRLKQSLTGEYEKIIKKYRDLYYEVRSNPFEYNWPDVQEFLRVYPSSKRFINEYLAQHDYSVLRDDEEKYITKKKEQELRQVTQYIEI